MNNKNNDDRNNNSISIGLGLCYGTSLGVIVGIMTENVPVCIAIGASLGMCIGILISSTKK